jgi:hypothetical protein
MAIAGAMINKIGNRVDQVSAHPIYFHFNDLDFSFRHHFLSIRGRYLETRLYVGDNSSGCVHDLMYTGKAKPTRVYETPYATIIRLACIHVCKQVS